MIDHDDHPSSHDDPHDDPLASLIRAAAPEQFDAGFTDRVVARVRTEREPSLSLALERQFRRVVPIAAAASLILAAYNWWGARGSEASALEAALNLPRVSLASAYSASTLFGETSIPVENP
jgi:hypothetical protein